MEPDGTAPRYAVNGKVKGGLSGGVTVVVIVAGSGAKSNIGMAAGIRTAFS